jgi:hypothetical protein
VARRLALASLWVLSGYYAVWSVRTLFAQGFAGVDSHAYWLTGHATSGNLYVLPAGAQDAYLYSPVFAMVIHPLTLLPYPVFGVLWASCELGLFIWLLRRGPVAWTVPFFCIACVHEVILGNIYAFLATAVVLAIGSGGSQRRAAAAAFPVLTKVTPGVLGLWYLARREYTRFAIAAATTLGLVAVSLVLVPGWWVDYVHFMTSGSSHASLWFPARLVAAVVLTVVAARLDRPVLVPFAVLLSLPVLGGPSGLSVLAAVPRLSRRYLRSGSTDAKSSDQGRTSPVSSGRHVPPTSPS